MSRTLIKTFAIISTKQLDSTKEKGLADSLKSGHFAFMRVKGRWGRCKEWSYFIINISFKTASYYVGKYELSSFIFSQIEGDKVISQYCEISDTGSPFHRKYNPYIIIEENIEAVNAAKEGYHPIIGQKFKYTIPSDCFNQVSETIHKILSYNNVKDIDHTINMMIYGVGMHPWYLRGGTYRNLYDLVFISNQ